MAGLTGKSATGVGQDVVDYMTEVAKYFGITIRVTSGYRTADDQAQAMYDNWVKMDSKTYDRKTLPLADYKTLTADWKTAHDKKATAKDPAKAKADFLKLAKDRVGKKTKHHMGRALDVSQEHITAAVYKAIRMRMVEKKEGRTDIYHFESVGAIPAVDDAMRARWHALKATPPTPTHAPAKPHPARAKHVPDHPGHSHPTHAHHGHHGCC
jgi:hypothetical protein